MRKSIEQNTTTIFQQESNEYELSNLKTVYYELSILCTYTHLIRSWNAE